LAVSDLAQTSKAGVSARSGHFDVAGLSMLAVVAVLLLAPLLAGGFLLYSLSLCFANALAVLSVSMLVRFGGEVSIGHSFFVALGAYAVAIVEHRLGLSIVVSLPLATLLGAGAGFVFAFPSRRLSGIYLAVATMALALALPEILIGFEKFTGGFEGLYIAQDLIPGIPKALQHYYVALAVLVLALLALARFAPSRFGRAVLALRDDDLRAEALGFPTYRYKLVVFVVAGALGGVAGALSVNLQGYVSPNALHWTQSGTLMVMVILGGVATVWGGLAGAAVLLLLQEVLAATTEHHEFWTGWVLLAVVLFARQGIVGLWTRRRAPSLS